MASAPPLNSRPPSALLSLSQRCHRPCCPSANHIPAGNANRLLATRLDAILTSELTSGRDAARAKRKALIGQSEALIDRCEVLVKRYDSEKDAVAAAKPGPDAAPE